MSPCIFWFQHRYELVNVSMEHTYEFRFPNDVVSYPTPIEWDEESSERIIDYSITSTLHFMCQKCKKIKSQLRDGDWSHLLPDKPTNKEN